jgi:hypothetical protein
MRPDGSDPDDGGVPDPTRGDNGATTAGRRAWKGSDGNYITVFFDANERVLSARFTTWQEDLLADIRHMRPIWQ